MWYTKGALISLSHGFVKYQSPYDLLGSFILPYSIQFVHTVFIIVVINHNDRLSHLFGLSSFFAAKYPKNITRKNRFASRSPPLNMPCGIFSTPLPEGGYESGILLSKIQT